MNLFKRKLPAREPKPSMVRIRAAIDGLDEARLRELRLILSDDVLWPGVLYMANQKSRDVA